MSDTLQTRQTLKVGSKNYTYYSLKQAEKKLGDLSTLPFSLKILLENLLRHENGTTVTVDDIKALVAREKKEIAFHPARVLMQDFTGVPAVVDLAAMRDAMKMLGDDPAKINPLTPVDLVIDHSVNVNVFASKDAFSKNVSREFTDNRERYEFLRWGQEAFENFRVVPPGTGICHQVNLEYLGKVVWTNNQNTAYPDTVVGTDSHTTMINGLGILGWGVGGIEAEAAMLGQPISMLIPDVIGFELTGKLPEGATATDLVLTVTQILRKHGVVGKFVEFFGNGLDHLSLADRATIANMAPEYGATCGIFPIDEETIRYLKFSGRDDDVVALVEQYAKIQNMWRPEMTTPNFTEKLSLDMNKIEPSLAGPKRPQDRVTLSDMQNSFHTALDGKKKKTVQVKGEKYELSDGAVTIAAITSCTNTSNPSVMLAAGLVAKKANDLGLKVAPWVKTSLAPGSQVVTDYLLAANLQKDLDDLGFNLVGYGCTTCIGNSGPLPEQIGNAVDEHDLSVAGVLSGNRNFEGRINPHVKLNYLASPPLVVAYALAGTIDIDLKKDPIGTDKNGNKIYLKDIWPTNAEIKTTLEKSLTPEMFKQRYANVFHGGEDWQKIETVRGLTYNWKPDSTYVKHPPYFENMPEKPVGLNDIHGARPLAILGDSVTTDHISPAGAIKTESPAGKYLMSKKTDPRDFNSYGSRRGNHEIMMRGTFANIRLQNKMRAGTSGGVTKFMPDGTDMSIYDAAMKYQQQNTPLVVIGGKDYGMGSSRDWAAKGTKLLGVKAVLVQSFERIHRSNLIGMGVLPLQFKDGDTAETLNLTGAEIFDISGIAKGIKPKMDVEVKILYPDGMVRTITALCRIDTQDEVNYFLHDGILTYVLRNLHAA